MKLSISHNFPDVQKALDRLHKDVATRALASAVNKTVAQAKTQMGREITAEFNVSAAYVRQRLRIRRAAFRQGRFGIEAALIGGDGIKRSANIIRFVEKKVSLAEGRRRAKAGTQKQLFVKVKRKGGTKPLEGAFIGNKGRTVFIRTGSKRLPIKPVQVIDVGQMFNTRRINAKVVSTMRSKFPEVFAREARFYLSKWKGR